MGILETLSKVNITEKMWGEALENHNVVPDGFEGVAFYRVVKKVGNLEKGCVITDSEIIFAFPRIARIL
ncbi:hypothetical protein LCGC14_1842260 [marine sediment metagenome]|uniref:Uncharacterized protein n=1 Tax=marine sediment metagenome TaxID=412755 RepID=A0A0F9GCZ2_9ZZZZ